MTHPPRFASWLLTATLFPDAEAIAGDLCEEFQERMMSRQLKAIARWWYVWQVARSLAPLFFRSWQRASVTRASTAMIAAGAAASLPGAVLLSLRTFVLSQVPLKTTAELSSLFVVVLLIVLAVSVVLAFALGTRLLQGRNR